MERALRTRMKADAAITAIVGSHVHWKRRPERSPYPSLVLTLVNSDYTQSHDGLTGFRPSLVRFSCFAEDLSTAVALRGAVIDVILQPAIVDGTEFLVAQGVSTRSRQNDTDAGVIDQEIVEATLHHT